MSYSGIRQGRFFLAFLGMVTLGLFGAVLTGVNAQKPPKSEPHQFNSPVRIASGFGGNTLVVSDINARQVHFLKVNDLTSKSSIDLAGRPSGIAQRKNEVVIANQENGSVCIYSKTGIFSHCLGSGPGEFQQPNDLEISISGKTVYVLDTKAKKVLLYDLATGSSTGEQIGLGSLIQPTALALSKFNNSIYVSDFGDKTTSPRIQIFNQDGSYNRSIIGGKSSFSTPQGLYVDEIGRVFLADALSGEILVFSETGEHIGTLGGLGTEEGKLFYPLDVHVDEKSQDVYVADNRNGRIAVFSNGGVLP